MTKPMTKAAYLRWLDTRGEVGQWKIEKCRAADTLVKQEALKGLAKYLRKQKLDPKLEAFIYDVANAHFGSVDVDILLTHLRCYPEWLGGGLK